jgi:RNA polymerase sigma-70 factor (ECF subfamily)
MARHALLPDRAAPERPPVGSADDGGVGLFDALYEEHRQALHAFFLGRTSDPELALDLLQEAFVRVWRNQSTLLVLDPPRRRAWIFAVARNLVVDQYRSRAARSAARDALAASLDPSDQVEEGPEVTTERDRELRLVDEAISRLPEDLRTALLLQVLGEKTSAEIGELLDRPAGTVRYQISRARKLLTEELGRLDAADSASEIEMGRTPLDGSKDRPASSQDIPLRVEV